MARNRYPVCFRLLAILVALSLILSGVPSVVTAQDEGTLPEPPAGGYPERIPTYSGLTVSVSAVLPATASALATAMDINPADLVSASLGASDSLGVGVSNSKLSHFPTRNSTFAILATGRASNAATANTSGSLSYVLGGLNNTQGNDLVQLRLELRVPSDKNCMNVDFGYYSEEYPEFVGSVFNDTFTAELGGASFSIVGNEVVAPQNFAFDTLGQIISVNTSFQVNAVSSTGTTYDGGTQLLRARRTVTPGQTITVVFSVQDLGDSIFDSAVFLDNFEWVFDNNCPAGSSESRNPIVVIVHGYQGAEVANPGFNCANDLESLNSAGTNSTLDALPLMFKQAGYEVWLAKYETHHWFRGGTPSIYSNAVCLRTQIQNFTAQSGNRDLILVAHSMGGIVSRMCLSLFPECRQRVKALYTLGSPHAGLSSRLITIQCKFQTPGMCDLSRENMKNINTVAPNQRNIRYTFIGGNHFGPDVNGAVNGEGDHDGVVGSYSAVGWLFPNKVGVPENWWGSNMPTRIWTDETHTPVFNSNNGQAYTANRSSGATSYAFQCVQWLQGRDINPNVCGFPFLTDVLTGTPATTSISQTTEVLSGFLNQSSTITRTLPIDSGGKAVVSLIWSAVGNTALVLIDPNGQLIDPVYAAASNGAITYAENMGSGSTLGSASYSFVAVTPGTWQLRITANNNPLGVDYYAFAELETSRVLSVATSTTTYRYGQTAIFTSSLQNPTGGITNASLNAVIRRSDSVTDTIALTHQGGGVYATSYAIPNAPGYMNLSVIATGLDNGTAFSRQQDLLLGVAPQTAQFTGSYSALTPDTDFNGKYDQLDVQVGANVTAPGSYSVVGSLLAGGQAIAQTGAVVSLAPGVHTVTLSFSGNDIRVGQWNGPYTLANLSISDNAYGGIPAQSVASAWTTPAYNWQDFGSCYTLIKGSNPSVGGLVSANPAPNCNNGTQYAYGTVVNLTATPSTGFLFANWIVNASGEAPTAVVTMNDNKVVKANFAPMLKVYLPLIRR